MLTDAIRRNLRLFIWFWLFLLFSPAPGSTADSKAGLTVGESGADLYAQQDVEAPPIAKLQKGEELTPLAEAVGAERWYLVRTRQGLVGWIRAAQVSLSEQAKESFKEQKVSTWSARTNSGRTFEGTWSVEPGPSADKAAGTWTLRDAAGTVASRGTWSAQKFSTGWSGVWRAAREGQPGEIAGSWTADLPHNRDSRFAELFEAAAREAIRGIWNAGGNSGSWSIRAAK
jgi:Bacterial SH3 domain